MPKHRLMLIFVATILTPGLILGFFGVRALMQERQLADRQIRERLDVVAESTGRRLELELRDWQQAAGQLAGTVSPDAAAWPDRVRTAVMRPGAAVVLKGSTERPQVLPEGQFLYELSPASIADRPLPRPASITQAELLEVRDKQYGRAIDLYRALLASAAPGERAAILHGLARTLKKAGQIEESLRAFRLLEKEPPVRIGSLPSDLLALYEISSLEPESMRSGDAVRLYQALVHGTWRLEKSSYFFYSEQVRRRLPQDENTAKLIAEEQDKLALSLTAERFLDQPRTLYIDDGGVSLAFWRPEPFAAILLGDRFVRERFFPAFGNPDFSFALLAPGGQMLAGDSAHSATPRPLLAAYALQTAEFPLRLEVWPKDPAAMYAGVSRQQNLYLGMLGIVVALLAFGSYLTMRTLKTEIAMAQMKSDFVSTVSHEFRSPLAGLNQLGEMLRDGRVRDESRRQEYYEMIVTETQRLRRLVENILDFSRMEDGRKQYRFEPMDPAGWLREVAEDFRSQVAGRGFAVETSIPNALPSIVADRETLTTAVHNLLDNAVKYSRDSNIVQLEANASENGLSILVRDRGAGIREEDRPHIFEKFYRGGGELAREVKGVGLGLNLVQHIVKAHGGTMDFDTAEGEGSTFTIRLKTMKEEP